MAIKITGVDEVLMELEKLNNPALKKQVYKNAIDKGGEVLLKSLQNTVPRALKNSKSSYRYLDSKTFLNIKGNNISVKNLSGIHAGNWERTKGLWFHNFGFRGHPADNSFERAYEKSKSQAESVVIEELKRMFK